jgi:HD-GYP domain-containing protein (c-di-GMP phosphodiesterase class II)
MQVNPLDKIINQLNEETSDHSKRVGYYAYILAREMSYTQHESKDIAIAAMTHDLGKKDIDQAVLNKNGKLTKEEFDEIKLHPEMGYQELKKLKSGGAFTDNQLEKMKKVARYHHEKYDGNGYPYGLKKNEIPVEANLVCLVDAFDALSCKRVYKKAWEESEVKEWLISQKEKMFNPSVVDAYEKAHDKIQLIKEHIESSNKKINTNNFEQEIEFVLEAKGFKFKSENNITRFLSENKNNPEIKSTKTKKFSKG